MRRSLKYGIYTTAILFSLLVLSPFLLYIPSIQDFIQKQAIKIISEKSHYKISVGHISLKFPFILNTTKITVIEPGGDTLLQSGNFETSIKILPLFKKEIDIDHLDFKNTIVRYNDTLTQFSLAVDVDRLTLSPNRINMNNNEIDINLLQLTGGIVQLETGISPVDTTTNQSAPIDWQIRLKELSLQQIDFDMHATQMAINAQVENLSGTQCEVSLSQQTISVGKVILDRGDIDYLAEATDSSSLSKPIKTSTSGQKPASLPWTVKTQKIIVRNTRAAYRTKGHQPVAGFDPKYIVIDDVNIAIDSLYNQSSDIAIAINDISLSERCGLQLSHLNGGFSMDSNRIAINDLKLETPNSSLKADLSVPKSLFDSTPSGSFGGSLSVSVGTKDILLFNPSFISSHQIQLLKKNITTELQLSGNPNRIYLDQLTLALPDVINFSANGTIESILQPDRLSGHIHWDGTFKQLKQYTSLLPSPLRQRLTVPEKLIFTGNINAQKGTIEPQIRLRADHGTIQIDGKIDQQLQNYELAFQADSFPLHHFLPHDSVGNVSLSAQISGKGYDLYSAATQADFKLRTKQFLYNGYDYARLQIEAQLRNHYLNLNVSSDSPALQFQTDLQGEIRKKFYLATLKGDFKKLDIKQLNLSKEESEFSFQVETKALMNDSTQTARLDASIQNLILTQLYEQHALNDISLHASTDNSQSTVSLRAYGLTADFHSPLPIRNFVSAIDSTATVLKAQIDSGTIDLEKTKPFYPVFDLKAEIARKNLINSFLKSTGTTFKQIILRAEYNGQTPLSATAQVSNLQTNGVTLDSLTFRTEQSGSRLDYRTDVGIRNTNPLNISKIAISGYIVENKIFMNCFQKNKQNKIGFDIDNEVTYLDSLFRYTILSEKPILAFKSWKVNPDNRIDLYTHKKISADFALVNGQKEISVRTYPQPDREYPNTNLSIKGIDIQSIMSLFPTLPQLGGLLNSNIEITPTPTYLELDGTIGIDQFSYNTKNIGDINLSINGKSDNDTGYLLTAGLDIDSLKSLRITGKYTSSSSDQLRFDVTIPEFPLKSINAFLPDNTAELSGRLNSRFQIHGNLSNPLIDGAIRFDQSTIQLPAVGTTFTLTRDSIAIDNNRIRFEKFAITAPNKQQLYINGLVDARNFSSIHTDLSLSARNFQLINVKKNRNTMVYGKALANLNATITGEMNDLSIDGNIQLLNGTEATYSLGSSSLDVKDVKRNMVTFVSFRDSTDVDELDSIPSLHIGGMNVAMNIGIDNSVKMAVNLSSDGSSGINVQGGGNLSYSLNSLGDSRFSGRYNLTGGTVRYNPPIISAKLFTIQSGSYVEWVGDIANPTLHITAVQNMKTYVTENEKNGRMVDFDVIISIQNSLEDLALTFDLKAHNDMAIETQLASLTPEQRSVQAMNLLLYNTYTGPGTSATANLTDNPINAFIQKEVNQWARNNLKNIDFSIGIDQQKEMTDGIENESTNYSYKLSKSLFNDRFKIVLGGGFNSDKDTDSNLRENLIDDISLEYMLDKRNSMFIKIFRETNYESILEGEVIQTGVGFVVRKKLQKLKYLFRLRDRRNTNENK